MEERLISQLPLFASLPQEEIKYLVRSMRRVQFPAHTLLFREGDRGDGFHIILEGQIEVIGAFRTPEERILGVCGPGDYVGEVSLLDPEGLRTASVRTATAATLMEMTRDDFHALLDRRPKVAYELALALSRRLRENNNATIRDLQEKNLELARAYEDLKAAQEQVIEKEKLEHELLVAREIQRSLLPRSLPCIKGFDFGVRMLPARAVGGDFFDFIPLSPDKLGIAVGDVSDKGVPSAIFMAMTRSLLRAEASASKSPRETLQGVNRHLMDMNDTEMFVTVLYGVLDVNTHRFEYARAGHDIPFLCKTCGTVARTPMGRGQALGVFHDCALDEQIIELAPGCTFLIYTDGVTDAANALMEFFGVARLQEFLRNFRDEPAQVICDRLVQKVMDFQGATPQHDDVTLVSIRALES